MYESFVKSFNADGGKMMGLQHRKAEVEGVQMDIVDEDRTRIQEPCPLLGLSRKKAPKVQITSRRQNPVCLSWTVPE